MEGACSAGRTMFHLSASGKERLGRALAFGGNVNHDCESWPFHAVLVYIKFVHGETPRKGRDAMGSVTPARDQLMIYSGWFYSLASEMLSPVNTRL